MLNEELKKEYKPLVVKYAITPPLDANAIYLLERHKQSSIFEQLKCIRYLAPSKQPISVLRLGASRQIAPVIKFKRRIEAG